MDVLGVIGFILGVSAIIIGQLMEGGSLLSLVNGPAAFIVFGGTLGAVLLQTPLPVFLRAMRLFTWVFVPPRFHKRDMIEKILSWSNIARREGILGLENFSMKETDLFARKGLELIVDGSDPDDIRDFLELELEVKEKFDLSSAKVYESMGGYSPTIGIIGAILGLIHVMGSLSEPSTLGPGIAVAFVATIYGIGLANLILIPVSNKIKYLVEEEAQFREMIIDGFISIAEGENPRNIERKLDGYLDKTNPDSVKMTKKLKY
ncbi:MAG: flagellar motor protein [Gammaproteobacteria bacterium]|nr:flagellar motor protein [Gammaproteobacteria bacterium]